MRAQVVRGPDNLVLANALFVPSGSADFIISWLYDDDDSQQHGYKEELVICSISSELQTGVLQISGQLNLRIFVPAGVAADAPFSMEYDPDTRQGSINVG